MEKIKEMYLKYKEIINYLIFGVLTTVVSLGVYYICVYTFLNPENVVQLQIANIISWVAGVAFAYVTNRKFVFESKEENKLKPDTNLIKITNCFRKNQESELARKILPFPDSHATLKDEKFKLFQSF